MRGKVVPSERDEQESLFNYYFQDQKLKYETQFEKLEDLGLSAEMADSRTRPTSIRRLLAD